MIFNSKFLIVARDLKQGPQHFALIVLLVLFNHAFAKTLGDSSTPSLAVRSRAEDQARAGGSPETREGTRETRKGLTRHAKPTSNRWYRFSSPDGDFSLAFPLKPTLDDVSQGPVTLIRDFGATTNDGTRFSINFHDMGGDPRAPENNEWGPALEEIMSEADRERDVRVVQTHRMAKNIVEAEVWQMVPMKGNINYLRRSILRRGRIYTLACGPVINGREVDKPICRRFFNSMRFTK